VERNHGDCCMSLKALNSSEACTRKKSGNLCAVYNKKLKNFGAAHTARRSRKRTPLRPFPPAHPRTGTFRASSREEGGGGRESVLPGRARGTSGPALRPAAIRVAARRPRSCCCPGVLAALAWTRRRTVRSGGRAGWGGGHGFSVRGLAPARTAAPSAPCTSLLAGEGVVAVESAEAAVRSPGAAAATGPPLVG
jgi:hypothetical protein